MTSAAASVIILAAGQGIRMKSATAKVLHAIGGRTLLGHAMAAAAQLDPEHIAVVVRHDRDAVAAAATREDPAVIIADQDEIPGTGRAAQAGLAALDAAGADSGTVVSGPVVVMASDVPLLDGATLGQLLAAHAADSNAVTILTAVVADPTGYGRIVRGADNATVEAIIEHRDATEAQREIREINASIFVFDADVLRRGLGSLTRDNAQSEAYLTDVVSVARGEGKAVRAIIADDPWTVEGVNDRLALATLGRELNRRIVEQWMLDGVTIIDPATTWIDVDVTLEPDVTILPGTQLHGRTTVAAGGVVGPDTTLTDVTVGPGASVVRTHAVEAMFGAKSTIGPFSFIRPGTVVGPHGKVGAYVEVKNSVIGEDAKVPHLSYVGDATVGDGANVGAGTIVANYDGVAKHRTAIGAQARIGSNSVLVAPVTVGDGAYTAAGSAITVDIPPGALGVARGRQHTSDGWVSRKRSGTPSDRVAVAAQAADNAHRASIADTGNNDGEG